MRFSSPTPDIKASGVEVKRELAHDMPLLMVDRRRLLQALLNTIRNGAQAMPEGGVLDVATRVGVSTAIFCA
jgi:nitrogen-specific signal transduction histidine kinase